VDQSTPVISTPSKQQTRSVGLTSIKLVSFHRRPNAARRSAAIDAVDNLTHARRPRALLHYLMICPSSIYILLGYWPSISTNIKAPRRSLWSSSAAASTVKCLHQQWFKCPGHHSRYLPGQAGRPAPI